MGWRYKRGETPGRKEPWTAAPPSGGPETGFRTKPLSQENHQLEPALPSRAAVRLSFRQLGYFRRREIWESGLSLSYLH